MLVQLSCVCVQVDPAMFGVLKFLLGKEDIPVCGHL